jgi:hypothetical protein
VARPSEKALEYNMPAQGLSWEALRSLWQQIQDGQTPEWDPGRAFEHLVIRAFELSKLRIEYPFDVPPGGSILEEIDGIVDLAETPFLRECKHKESVDVLAIAKLQHQLHRRPPVTMGCVCISGEFTLSALVLADLAIPQQIVLWSKKEIEAALARKDFRISLILTYIYLLMYKSTDHSLHSGMAQPGESAFPAAAESGLAKLSS